MDIAEPCWGTVRRAVGGPHQLPPPSHGNPGFSLEDGYAVGRLLHHELVDSGWVAMGLKLGFTNQAIWSQLGLNRPFWAPIYDRTVADSSEVSLEGLVAPRIEPEIVLGFRADLPAGASAVEVVTRSAGRHLDSRSFNAITPAGKWNPVMRLPTPVSTASWSWVISASSPGGSARTGDGRGGASPGGRCRRPWAGFGCSGWASGGRRLAAGSAGVEGFELARLSPRAR